MFDVLTDIHNSDPESLRVQTRNTLNPEVYLIPVDSDLGLEAGSLIILGEGEPHIVLEVQTDGLGQLWLGYCGENLSLRSLRCIKCSHEGCLGNEMSS